MKRVKTYQILALILGLSCLVRYSLFGVYFVSELVTGEKLKQGDYVLVLQLPNIFNLRLLPFGSQNLQFERGDLIVMACGEDRRRSCLRRIVGKSGDWIEQRSGEPIPRGGREIKKASIPLPLGDHIQPKLARKVASDGRELGAVPAQERPLLFLPEGYLFSEELLGQVLDQGLGRDVASTRRMAHSVFEVQGKLKWIVFSVSPGDNLTGLARVRWSRFFSSLN